MPVTIDGSTGVGTPGVASTGAVSGTTGTFSGNVTANGLSTELRPLVLGTAQNSTSGTVIDFTGIPSWARRITLMFNGVSTSGTALLRVQLGTSGGVEATGYVATGAWAGASSNSGTSTAGFDSFGDGAANITRFGVLTLSFFGSNTWALNGTYAAGAGSSVLFLMSGLKSLSGTLDRVRITTANGTDTFDAGSINIMYE